MRLSLKSLLGLGLCVLPASADAGALDPDNIVVVFDRYNANNDSEVREFTRDGTLVQSWVIPDTGEETVRDVAVARNGRVGFYRGTFDASLTVLDPETGAFSEQTLAGFSTVASRHAGGVAAVDNDFFTTDYNTGYDEDNRNGLVRFDSTGGQPPQRFLDRSELPGSGFSASNYTDVSLGQDGLLYALRSAGRVEVIDPLTMQPLREVNLPWIPHDIHAVTADADGNIYAARWIGDVVKYDPDGVELDSISFDFVGAAGLNDVDIASDGTLIASRQGRIYVTDTGFSSYTAFNASDDALVMGFAAFAEAPPIPFGSPVPGDMNGDGVLDHDDIAAFVQALTDPAGYASAYPGLDPDRVGDFTGEGLLTNRDIAGFVQALPGLSESAFAVPEPGSLMLIGLSGLLVLRRRA